MMGMMNSMLLTWVYQLIYFRHLLFKFSLFQILYDVCIYFHLNCVNAIMYVCLYNCDLYRQNMHSPPPLRLGFICQHLVLECVTFVGKWFDWRSRERLSAYFQLPYMYICHVCINASYISICCDFQHMPITI